MEMGGGSADEETGAEGVGGGGRAEVKVRRRKGEVRGKHRRKYAQGTSRKWNCKRLAEIHLQVSMMQTGHTQQTIPFD